jgi:class 3 adenylate cyclase/predicted ATPase
VVRAAGGQATVRAAGAGYALEVDLEQVDAHRFERLISEAEHALREDPASARDLFEEAIRLWRGDPLRELLDFDFAAREADRLGELHAAAVEGIVEARFALGEHREVIGEITSLVAANPLRERPRRLLMLALYRSGRHAEALAAYRDAVTALDEIGLEPSPQLRLLEQDILRHEPLLAAPQPPADAVADVSGAVAPSASGVDRVAPDAASVPALGDSAARGPGAGRGVESARRPPEGTIALLLTDIEGSTRLAGELGSDWGRVLAEHHELVGGAIASEGGFVDATEGDAFLATFEDAASAARAAVAAQRALRAHRWPGEVGELQVRMGLHVGRVQRAETGYVGLEVHRAARVAAAAHGGQLLLTAAARELVGDELVCESVGVHRLKDFPAPAMLFCAVIDGRGAAAFPPPRTDSVRPTNLPAGRPALIGRDDELGAVLDAFATEGERLVTITGRGGAGKTSLALLGGIELLEQHPGGVWWVDLTTVESPEEVPVAIAAVVAAESRLDGSVEAAITTRLRNSGATLLVLDNMEHVLAAADSLCRLLDGLPDVRLLVSSRLPLRVDPERVISLDALDERSALNLIRRSVERRGKHPKLTDADRNALLEIVRLLDGLPLALELAAARLTVLTAVQLRDRLRESIDVLGETRGGRPARQRSLRAALESTLSLLDPSSRALFVRMGAFAGPVELDELERVLSGDGVDVLKELAQLVDAALAQLVETGDGTVRFGLPEALRQIASELLDGQPDGRHWRRAHAQRQYELVWAMRTGFVDRKTYLAARSAEPEVAAALRWASANHDPLEQAIAVAYAKALLGRGRLREGGAITERLVASPPADAEVRWLALCGHSSYLAWSGQLDAARDFADEACRVAPDAKARSAALILRGISNVFAGHTDAAIRDHAEATALAQELDDPAFLAGALVYEAQALMAARLLDEAAARVDEARTVGTPVDANELYGLEGFDGDLAMLAGRPGDALEPLALSLEQDLADGNSPEIVLWLLDVAEALAALGHDTEALEVAGMAESQAAEIGASPDTLFDDHLAALEQRIGPAKAAELKQHGTAANPADRVARACQLARSHAPAPTVPHG